MLDVTFSNNFSGPISPGNARIIGDLQGRYFLDKWRIPGSDVKGSQYCRTQRISATAMTFIGLLGGEKGDKAYVKVDMLGSFSGIITRAIGAVLQMDLLLSDDQREDLAKKISWLERRRLFNLPDNRLTNRFKPNNPDSSILFEDGRSHEAYLIDISEGGAAVTADRIPEVDEVIAIGRVVGRVVRRTDTGFAVQFIKRQSRDALESLLAPASVEMI